VEPAHRESLLACYFMIVLHEAYHSLALPCKHLLDHLQEPCFAVPAPTSTSDVSGWLLLKGASLRKAGGNAHAAVMP